MDKIEPINGLYDLSDFFRYIFALPYGVYKGYTDKSKANEYVDSLYDRICNEYQSSLGDDKNGEY